jgi:hypothetical protein
MTFGEYAETLAGAMPVRFGFPLKFINKYREKL